MRAALRAGLGAAAAGFVLFTAAAFSARLGFPFELFSHFTPQLAVAGAFLLGAVIALNWRPVAVLLLVLTTTLSVRWADIPPFLEPNGDTSDGNLLTVASFNMWGHADAAREFAAYAAQNGADILALSEAYNISEAEIASLFEDWPYKLRAAGGRVIGAPLDRRIYLLSRYPLSQVDTAGQSRPERPILLAVADTPVGPVQLAAIHPFPPYSHAALTDRNANFDTLAALVAEHGRFVVMGDLNTTPWSPDFRRLPGRRAGDTRNRPTWVTRYPLLGLPLDHVLAGPAFELVHAETALAMGSDHRAVLARLTVRE